MSSPKALSHITKSTALPVGAALIALTLSSFVLGRDHILGFSQAAPSVILLIAFVKVWLVASFFMDLRHGARWLNLLVTAWIALTCTAVVGLYTL